MTTRKEISETIAEILVCHVVDYRITDPKGVEILFNNVFRDAKEYFMEKLAGEEVG